ncbi:type II and III secretion system protein [Vibrio parahaemolyticus]|uniref:type II and III secretion system protein n=1 Tax=Vibrio parahaemolyticus TaxID=670 RepID=UPI00215BE6BA|nr:type II and III secretion system protein [Vibrio parahaemolyticus]MCR9867976.1 type II and III secretion system protein [Vibrio parahaemolyticus]
MMMKPHWIMVPITMMLINGCVSQDYLDHKANADGIQDTMKQARADNTAALGNVQYLTKPPALPVPIKNDESPDWLKQEVRLKADQLPLSMVLSMLLEGSDVDVSFDPDVNPNTPISVNMRAKRKSILNLISSLTHYGLTPEQDSLTVGYYQTETFTLSLPSGTTAAQQGSQSEESSEDEGETSSTKVDGQYITTGYNEVEITQEVADAVSAVLADEEAEADDELVGSVQVVPGLAAITVRTTPSRMAQARRVVETYQEELAKQVFLDIRVLEFRSNLGKDQGIDWNLVKDVGDGTLNFIIPGTSATSDLVSSSSGLAFQGMGKWDGTTAFIKALEQQGTVSTDTPIGLLTISSQPARISQTVKTPYLSDISTEVTDTTTSTSTTRGNVVEGIDMMVNTNVKDDFVWIRTAGKLTKIAGDSTEVIDDATLRFISTRSADLSFTNKLRYGQTVVIGSVKQQTQTANKSSSFGWDGLGSQVSGQETVETLILLTPRRVK